jgi:hypothetical protein
MKAVMISSLLFSLCNLLHGQDTINNFIVDQDEIIWQKIFQTNYSFDEFSERLKDSGLFDNIEFSPNKARGELKTLFADLKGAGFSEMTAPIFVSRSSFSSFAVLEYQEGKYRVTLRKILLSQKYNDPLSNQGEITALESYALNSKKEFSNVFKKAPSLILDYTFTKKLDFNLDQNNTKW